MSWFYQHNGKTHGPVSSGEIRELASKGLLEPDDPIWEEGTDQTQAIPASGAVDFSSLPQVASVPDWLTDIASQEAQGPAVEPNSAGDSPEWLEDMRLWIGLEMMELCPPEGQQENQTGSAGVAAIPDWLEGWLTPPKPAPAAKPEIPLAKPVKKSPPPKPAEPPAKIVQTPPPSKPAIPLAKPVLTPPPGPKPGILVSKPATAPVQALADKTLEETGFDLVTGRILDQEKFNQWKKQTAPATETSQQFLTNASQFEVFRKARTAIETWVDDDKNKLRILHADIQEIIRSPGIQEIFRDFAGFGFRQKLEKHLAFLVENRRKYETALRKGAGPKG
jgi:hypothetical protein